MNELILEKLRLTLKYHSTLNPKLWHNDKLDEDTVSLLLGWAFRFVEFSDLSFDRIKDVIFTGSCANYNFNKYSDIDIHIICDISDLNSEVLYHKKVEWTKDHPEIEIEGYPLEFYCHDERESIAKGQGAFSLLKDKWLIVPKHLGKIDILSDPSTLDKIQWNINYIKNHLLKKVGTAEEILAFKEKLWRGRTSGLEKNGEFSIENIVYKDLRNKKWIQHLNEKLDRLEHERN